MKKYSLVVFAIVIASGFSSAYANKTDLYMRQQNQPVQHRPQSTEPICSKTNTPQNELDDCRNRRGKYSKEQWSQQTQQNSGRQSGSNVSSLSLDRNQHILKYTPPLIGTSNEGVSCNEEGVLIAGQQAFCLNYRSADGSQWRTRIPFNSHGDVGHVYKIINGKPVLWVQFDPNEKRLLFASKGAQAYAVAHGSGKVHTATSSESAAPSNSGSDKCGLLSGTARKLCEGAEESTHSFGGLFK